MDSKKVECIEENKGVNIAQADPVESIVRLLSGANERELSIIHKFIRNLLKK